MLDKQVYRNLSDVTAADLDRVRENYERVADIVGTFPTMRSAMAALVADGTAGVGLLEPAAQALLPFGIQSLRRVVSTDLMPHFVIQVTQQLDATFPRLAYVASGPQLAAMLGGATPAPVFDATEYAAEELALALAKAFAQDDTILFGRVLLVQANARSAILQADALLNAPPPPPNGTVA
jgi:phosphoribosylaminoimidazole carboxylase/phosphoribosylaminoimidazole-succinocarboxamide synthase